MSDKHAELMKIGENAFNAIAEMVAALQCDYDRLAELRDGQRAPDWETESDEAEELAELEAAAGDCETQDDASERIQEDALSLRIFGERTEGFKWEATSFELLLTTGGPAVRIVGDLDHYGSPVNPRLEVQDWFTPWTEYPCDQDALQAYCDCFYMGEC